MKSFYLPIKTVKTMPELPEITQLANQMNKQIKGKRVSSMESKQPKNLNLPPSDFARTIKGKTVSKVQSRGKWLFIKLDPGYYLLINLGMNGDVLYFSPQKKAPEKYHFRVDFTDSTGFVVVFQWIGLAHLVAENKLGEYKLTAKLGMQPTDKQFTLEHLKQLLAGKKTTVKNFLLDQKSIAGIGNVYVQDTLFRAGLHPNCKVNTLTEREEAALHKAIRDTLHHAIKLGGLTYEKDFYGRYGRLTNDKFLVGYRTGKPCPACGTSIEKIRTGTTASYICPRCQRL